MSHETCSAYGKEVGRQASCNARFFISTTHEHQFFFFFIRKIRCLFLGILAQIWLIDWLIDLLFTFLFSFFILFWKTFDPMPCWNLYNWIERLLWRQIENSRVCVSHITLASLGNFFRTVIENPSQVCTGRSLSVSFFNETQCHVQRCV